MEETVCTEDEYLQNIAFWDRAWNMVKTPYKQLPELSYLQRIPELLKERKTSQLLDLGCGSGWLSVYLARQGFDVVGVDVAANALELARTWAADENLSITFRQEDISRITGEDASFGAVVANSIIEHLTYSLASRTLQRIWRLLEPGGLFLGCFDLVGTGPGEYYKLQDGSQIYTDKGRRGMLLRCFSDSELNSLFENGWQILELSKVDAGTRLLLARKSEC